MDFISFDFFIRVKQQNIASDILNETTLEHDYYQNVITQWTESLWRTTQSKTAKRKKTIANNMSVDTGIQKYGKIKLF